MHFFFQIQNLQLLNILYRWSGFCGQFWLCSFMFSFAIPSKVIIFVFFHYIFAFSFFFFYILGLFLFHIDVSIESSDCILSSSLALSAILITSSVNTLCLSLLNFCSVFNINLLFFFCFFFFLWILRLSTSSLFFLVGLF